MILCDIEDESALALAALLERAGAEPMVLRPQDLVRARHLHRVGRAGVSASLTLRDGRELDMAAVSLLINRFRAVPEAAFGRCAPADREYVRAEWSAHLASMLTCCGGPVLNPPCSDAPGGYPPGDIEAVHFAARCGLPVEQRRIAEDSGYWEADEPDRLSSHLVVGDRILPDLPEPLAAGARRLARVLGLPLLQVDFAPGADGEPVFQACTAAVEFRHAPGAALVAALRRIAGDGDVAGGEP